MERIRACASHTTRQLCLWQAKVKADNNSADRPNKHSVCNASVQKPETIVATTASFRSKPHTATVKYKP